MVTRSETNISSGGTFGVNPTAVSGYKTTSYCNIALDERKTDQGG